MYRSLMWSDARWLEQINAGMVASALVSARWLATLKVVEALREL